MVLQFFECCKQLLPSYLKRDAAELEKSDVDDQGYGTASPWAVADRQAFQPEKEAAKRGYERNL